MLFTPGAHEAPTREPWDERRVRAAVAAIAADAERTFDPERLWPADEDDAWVLPQPLTGLYAGAGGVLWALDALRRRGYAEPLLELAPAARRALGSWREHAGALVALELATPAASSLLEGEAGLLLLVWRLAPDAALADALHARVRENVRNETNELMWGAPGTMLAARAMHRATGEERWADAWRESADELWLRRDDDGLWTQRLQDGRSVRVLGSAHGAAGNVAALLDGGELLDSERRAAVTRDTAALLARTAVVEDGLANWPYREGGELAGGDGEIRVQWCTGAPGMVVSAGSYLDEELLLAGAELAWRAGPPGPAKGAGICHGTAGNGYALLAAFERTGDELWLERARRFAVHALGQVERGRAARGRGRYSLWTGDPGVALYAADCVDALGAFPVVDPRERGG